MLDGKVAREAVRDRIVVIGATVTGGGDVFPTPFDPVMPGVEIIATAVSQLMTGDGLLRDRSTRAADAVLAVVLTLLLVGLLAWRRSADRPAVDRGGASDLGRRQFRGVFARHLAERGAAGGCRRPAGHPVRGGAALAEPPAGTVFRHEERFAAAVSGAGAAKMADPESGIPARTVHQDAAIVFIDLSGFTSLSETLGMDAVLGMLKDFHALVDREVVAHRGVITSFQGDGAMILFGLPESHQERRPQCRAVLRRPLQPHRTMDRNAAAIDRVTNRLQDRRPLRADRGIPARRRQLPAHYRDRRQRERGEPPDGSCREARRGAGAERRSAAPGRPRMRPAGVRRSHRPQRDADQGTRGRALGLALAQDSAVSDDSGAPGVVRPPAPN